MSQPSSQAESKALPFLCLSSVQTLQALDEVHPYWGELSPLFSPPIQMLITPRNPSQTHPESCLTQYPGHPWPLKLTGIIGHHEWTGAGGCAWPSFSLVGRRVM